MSKAILEAQSLAPFLDPIPAQDRLSKETTFADAIEALNESATGELLVLDEKQPLWGTLDRDGLFQIIARIALTQTDKREDARHRKLGDLLPANPVYVALDDSALVASATMLDHAVSWLPVVKSKDDLRPVGHVRAVRISNFMIDKMAQPQPGRAQVAG
jgi:CBS domain-containing protein